MTRGKLTRIVLALCLASVLVVGSTLAYLTWTSATPTVNMFKFSDNISAEVIEEEWDDHGKDDAEKMMPGSSVDKDPAIKNTGDATTGIDIYVALRLTFTDGNGTTLNDAQMTKLLTQIAFYHGTSSPLGSGYNTAVWEAVSGTSYGPDKAVQVWFYKDTSGLLSLSPQDPTDPIFDKVEVLSSADIEFLSDTLGGFNIKVEGAAVQTSNITKSEAETELLNLFFPPAP